MSETEAQFIISVFLMTIISGVLFVVSLIAFNLTLSEKDAKLLEQDEPPENATLATHTTVLAIVNFISKLSFFINSAILVAIGIKEML